MKWVLTSDATFCVHLDLIAIKKKKWHEAENAGAKCPSGCLSWFMLSLIVMQYPAKWTTAVITVVEYSRKCSLTAHGLQDSVHVSLDLQNMIVASFFHCVLWHLLTGVPVWHWTLDSAALSQRWLNGRIRLTNQLPTVKVEWMWMVLTGVSHAP